MVGSNDLNGPASPRAVEAIAPTVSIEQWMPMGARRSAQNLNHSRWVRYHEACRWSWAESNGFGLVVSVVTPLAKLSTGCGLEPVETAVW